MPQTLIVILTHQKVAGLLLYIEIFQAERALIQPAPNCNKLQIGSIQNATSEHKMQPIADWVNPKCNRST